MITYFLLIILSVRFFDGLDLPAEMRIIDSKLLSNLSISDNSLGEFECQTSLSNPQASLRIIRQSNDGVKHSDIQYRTASNYVGGMNSIKFLVSLVILSTMMSIHLSIFSYPLSIYHCMEIY